MATEYTARDIVVLSGREAVRKRPGMYIGGTGKPGLHHLLWEVVDNAVDEAMNGHATTIEVTLHEDGRTVSIADNGRGIPVDEHDDGRSALEIIFTTLHAGGKFDNASYETSGGLHGVGAAVVNALSEELVARVKRGGAVYEQRYRRGVPQGPVEQVESGARGTGTEVTFNADAEIFEDVDFDGALVAERLEIASYLHRGVRILFRNRRTGAYKEFKHDGVRGPNIATVYSGSSCAKRFSTSAIRSSTFAMTNSGRSTSGRCAKSAGSALPRASGTPPRASDAVIARHLLAAGGAAHPPGRRPDRAGHRSPRP